MCIGVLVHLSFNHLPFLFFFFFNDTATTEIYTLSLHDALPISSFTRDQLRNEPEAFATSQIKENKHYKAIEDGIGPYQQMSAADRQKLLADVKAMDENASMALSVPASLRAGQEVQVTASVKGGHG